MGEPEGLVYTKGLERLHAKPSVTREHKGMAFLYRPRVARAVVDGARTRAFSSRLLGPAPRSPESTLIDAMESLDPKLLDELAELINTRRRSRHGT